MEAKASVGGGKGRKGSRAKKLFPLNLRTTAEVRQRMEKAAKANGRSLASEVEDRLLGSFNKDDIQQSMFGGPEMVSLFKMLAAAADIVEHRTGKSWATDYDTFVAVRASWQDLINKLRPDLASEDSAALDELEDLDVGDLPPRPEMPEGYLLLAAQVRTAEKPLRESGEPSGLLSDTIMPEQKASLEQYEKDVANYEAQLSTQRERLARQLEILSPLRDRWDQAKETGKKVAEQVRFPAPQGRG